MATELLNKILPAVQHLHAWGYALAFLAALGETALGIGLLLPGSTIILLLGSLAARGYFDVGDLVCFAVLGAIAGDNLNYFLGRRFGSRLLHSGIWFLNADHFQQARSFMQRHGAKGIFLGRFIPSVKEVAPFVAGSLGMERKSFLLWNILGAIGWGLQWVLAGYVFSRSLTVAQIWLSRTGLLLGLLLLFILVLAGVRWLIVSRGRVFVSLLRSLAASVSHALRTNEHVARWLAGHPRTVSFCRRRLAPGEFSGLPLTCLILALVYVLALFGGAVEDLVSKDPIVAADLRLAHLLAALRTGSLTTVFTWITLLGKSQVVLAFLATAIALLLLWRRATDILPLGLAAAGSESFTALGKLAFHRPRPETALYLEHSFSFPSGHATISVALYGFLAYLVVRAPSSWTRKVNLAFFALLLILAIGLSRLYLGEHYLSDVWGGYLVGAMWLIIAITLAEWFRRGPDAREQLPPGRATRLLSLCLLAGAAAFYVLAGLRYHPPPAPPAVAQLHVVAAPAELFTDQQLKYTESLTGERQEPLNILLVAQDESQLSQSLRQAGWIRVSEANYTSLLQSARALFMKTSFPAAPVAPTFWNAKPQDLSFARAGDNKGYGTAHHVRIWRTNTLLPDRRQIFVALANANSGFKWLLIPKISADLDRERELLSATLQAAGQVRQKEVLLLVPPQAGFTLTGDIFFTDGRATLLFLSAPEREPAPTLP